MHITCCLQSNKKIGMNNRRFVLCAMQRELQGSQHERHEHECDKGESMKQKVQQKRAVRAALGISVSIWGFCHCGTQSDTELLQARSRRKSGGCSGNKN
jgi:hypothetical protein